MPSINFLAVALCAVASMVLGMVWYSKSLFGKAWGEVIGMNPNITPEEIKNLQKTMGPLYLLQFVLSFFEAYVLAYFINTLGGMTGIMTGIWICLGFVMPTIAGQAMWGGKSKKLAWKMFWITLGYQLVLFVLFGYILSIWK